MRERSLALVEPLLQESVAKRASGLGARCLGFAVLLGLVPVRLGSGTSHPVALEPSYVNASPPPRLLSPEVDQHLEAEHRHHEDALEEHMCRICFEKEGEGAGNKSAEVLISPCKCTGTQKFVHRSCLLSWQRAQLSSGAGNADIFGSGTRLRLCSVCRSEMPGRDVKKGYLGHYEEPGRFAFCIGDIVVHRLHGQIGVVAERYDVCQLGELWMALNAPPGMNPMQPFYTILVNTQGMNFTRHGAQSSHRRWDISVDGIVAPPIDHPDVADSFGRLDAASARYQLLNESAAVQETLSPEWDSPVWDPAEGGSFGGDDCVDDHGATDAFSGDDS
eukprot:gnl/TRDRNA2_/TRDRNA2_57161_c0_seq1.p1 gnl/TRDRNA2_/TRDRNA2_57161_c0~~gnl/TRDRNA2_/TRDRNA2_57161_c0_seq1.p1  ORF type:complete len:333 (-),score=42.94 gnl/TRDRNA2_/TRDRNA2_57161_c0_seq1:301-1299(-)